MNLLKKDHLGGVYLYKERTLQYWVRGLGKQEHKGKEERKIKGDMRQDIELIFKNVKEKRKNMIGSAET